MQHIPRGVRVAGLVAAAAVTASGWLLAAGRPESVAAADAMERFLSRPAAAHSYRAERRLEASGRGHSAWMEVQTDFTPSAGLRYEVTREGGSGYIRSRVLRSLLDEEQRLIARGATGDVALSPANYRFTPRGTSESGLVVVALQPLRKERALILGHMLLTAGAGDLVRVEGRLVKNPSFWITRTHVVRTYQRVNGVLMPVSLETRAQLRFMGSSRLRMSYHYSSVNERPVAE